MDSTLRPREIQTRIRFGQSPETVAAAAQTSLERIMGFATPVLAERAHVADQAQKASVRRRGGDGPAVRLGEAVGSRLEGCSVEPSGVEWDAWRREDGRWTVIAEYGGGEDARRAEFGYDAAGRYVVAEDDEARWLVGEPQPGLSAAVPLLDAMEEDGLGEQIALGDDAIEVVTGQAPAAMLDPPSQPWLGGPVGLPLGAASDDAEASDDEPTSDLSETVAAVRGLAAADALFEAAPLEPRKPRPGGRMSARSRTRSSMPSWDDIMLGSSRAPE